MKMHDLKVWKEHYGALLSGEKMFELRLDDRNFKVGDILKLREFVPCKKCNGTGVASIGFPNNSPCSCMKDITTQRGSYTGAQMLRRVDYILKDFKGLKEGYCILGLSRLGLVEGIYASQYLSLV